MKSHVKLASFSLFLIATAQPARATAQDYVAWSGHAYGSNAGLSELVDDAPMRAEARDPDGNGRVDLVTVTQEAPGGAPRVYTFGAVGTGRDLEPGFFGKAVANAAPGRPLLKINDGTLCALGGESAFEVLAAEFDLTSASAPRVVSFLARFEIQCNREPWPVRGEVAFAAPDVPRIELARYEASSSSLRVYGRNVETATGLLVDGVGVAFAPEAGGGLRVRKLRLSAGRHEIRVLGGSYTSPVYALDASTPPFAKSSYKAVSDPGEFVGEGRRHRYPKGPVSLLAFAGPSGLPLALEFSVPDREGGNWTLDFSAAIPNGVFAPGVYSNVARYPFQEDGQAGMSVTAFGHGCNSATGTFTVRDYALDQEHGVPRVLWSRVSFEYHCEGGPAALAGTIAYLAPERTAILAATYAPDRRELRVRATNVSSQAELYLNGQRLGPTRVEGDTVVLENVSVAPGTNLVTISARGPGWVEYSQPWVFAR